MQHIIRVEPHPIGVVVIDDEDGKRELLIEGEECCGILFEQLQQIAKTTHKFEIDDLAAATCRLNRL
jgi:hypothetical protein